jgi:D-aspartate ligase
MVNQPAPEGPPTSPNQARNSQVMPEKAQPGWPGVVVAGGFQTGVVLMRDLSRRGLQVHCIDSNPAQQAFRTVYGKAHLCPNADEQPEDWLHFMIRLAAEIGGKPVLMSSSDQYVTAFALHADILERHYLFCRASAAVQGLLATKKRQYSIAGEHGLPVPRTEFVKSASEVARFAAEARFPCILKPLHFREWKRIPRHHALFEKKLIVVLDGDELDAQYQVAAQINPEMVVQEMIEGPDTAKMVYLSCYDRSSRRIGSCMMRQIRTEPIGFGSAGLVEPMTDPETDSLCDSFLRSLNYVGLCEIELKRDTRDGQVKMIEANPRYSVTADAAHYAGVDLGWLHYLDILGETVTPVEAGKQYFRHICLFRDIGSFRSYIKAGLLTWGEFVRSYRGPVFFFDYDWHDPRVTFGSLVLAAKLLAAPMIRRFLPKRNGE